jgi:ankyrin repeat protein
MLYPHMVVPVLILLMALTGCQNREEVSEDPTFQARKDLAQLGIPFTPEALLERMQSDDRLGVKALLAAGMTPNVYSERDNGQSILMMAVNAKKLEIAEILAAHPNLQVDMTDGDGNTALMFAASSGNLSLTQRLLDRGAAVNLASSCRKKQFHQRL